MSASAQIKTLSDNRLSGSFPSSLGRAAGLMSLYLSSNALSGTIPDLGGTQLLRIFSSNNRLSGTMHSSMSLLTRLRYLAFSSNRLSGSSTSEFKSWNLLLFSVFNNRDLDWDLGLLYGWEQCGSLFKDRKWTAEQCETTFLLHKCAVTGTIPARNRLSNVTYFLLADNQVPHLCFQRWDNALSQISGTIPASLFEYSPIMTTIDVSSNGLSGTLPLSIGDSGVETFLASSMQISGSMPDSWLTGRRAATQLKILSLSRNYLHGPTLALDGAHNLTTAILSSNCEWPT